MLKKTLSLFLTVFLLVACGPAKDPETKEDPAIGNEETYIEPVRDIFIFGELDGKLKEQLKIANCGSDFSNYQFKMLGKQIYEGTLYDIEGREVDLTALEGFYLEIVSVNCSHCKKQLSVIPELAKDADYPMIQYFNVGTPQEIRDLYTKEGLEIPDDMIIIGEDEKMEAYIKEVLDMKSYPTLITCKNGRVSFDSVGEQDEESFAMLSYFGFDEIIDPYKLSDGDGNPQLKLSRSIEDVKNDLSEENLAALSALDHDGYSSELTFQLMGKKADLRKTDNSHGDVYFSQIDDFSAYENEKLVLLYTYLRDNSETEKVAFINELMEGNRDVKYIVILVEGLESSSAALRNMSVSFNCPVVSVLGRMPDDFFSFGLVGYPTAVFVDRGTFTGAYSAIEDKEKIAEAIRLFLSDECIAYQRNN